MIFLIILIEYVLLLLIFVFNQSIGLHLRNISQSILCSLLSVVVFGYSLTADITLITAKLVGIWARHLFNKHKQIIYAYSGFESLN